MNIQCPFCFEHVPVKVEAIRTGPSRRCPQGKSARENPAGSLRHCYCKVVLLVPSNVGQKVCCKCGEALKA